MDGRAPAGFAVDGDLAAVGEHDVARGAQAEPGALADWPGGEERFEGAFTLLGIHADAVVADANGDALGVNLAGDAHVAGAAGVLDGLHRVVDQVVEELVQVAGQADDGRQNAQFDLQADAGWQLTLDDAEGMADAFVHVSQFLVGTVDVGEALEVGDDTGDPLQSDCSFAQQVEAVFEYEVHVQRAPGGLAFVQPGFQGGQLLQIEAEGAQVAAGK